MLIALAQFVPPVKIGVGSGTAARISPQPIPFPAATEWQRATTAHFDILSSAGERRTREVAARLETLADALHELQRDAGTTAPRARVILFGKRRDAQPYFDVLTNRANARVSGLFVAQRDRGAMIIDASRSMNSDRTPYHELVHYLLAGNARRLPLWLEEGLAEFYSNADLGGGAITLGYAIPEHLELLSRRAPMPLDALFALRFESEAAAHPLFYAECWALVDYLMSSNRAAFPSFVKEIASGVDAETALRSRFHVDSKSLRSILASYAGDRHEVTFRLPATRDEVAVQPEALRRAELLTELGRFLASFESLTAEAERHIRAALELEPQNAHALAALAALRQRDRKYDEAESLFTRAVAAAPGDGSVALEYAEALLRDELGPFAATNEINAADVERFRRARKLAQEALKLGADPARAYGVIGISCIGDADRTPGIDALTKAHALAPQRADYALHLAALLRRAGRVAEADALFSELDAMHDAQVSFAARAIVVAVDLAHINDLIRAQKLDEALAGMRALLAKTDDARAKADLERQIANIERVRRTNGEIEQYNRAIAVSNTGHRNDAIQLLDQLLATAQDPQVIADAKRMRSELAKRKR